MARAMPCAPNEPCGTTPSLRRPEQERAALRLGVDRVAQPAERRPQQQPAGLGARLDIAASRTARSSVSAVPSITLRKTLPVKPSVTITSASPVPTAKPSTLPTKRRPSAAASAAWAACTSSRALAGLRAVGEQRDARRRDPEHGLHEGGAHVGELDEVLRAGPRRWRRSRAAGTGGRARARGRRAPAGGRRARASGGTARRRARRRSSRRRRARRRRPPATACTAWTIEASGVARTARAGIGGLRDRDGRVDDLDRRGAGRDLAPQARTRARGRRRQAAASAAPRATSAGPGVGPVGVQRDRQRLSGHGRCNLVLVVVIVVVHVHDLTAGVEAAVAGTPGGGGAAGGTAGRR